MITWILSQSSFSTLAFLCPSFSVKYRFLYFVKDIPYTYNVRAEKKKSLYIKKKKTPMLTYDKFKPQWDTQIVKRKLNEHPKDDIKP